MQGKEFYTSQQLHFFGNESTQTRTRTKCRHVEAAEGQAVDGVHAAMGQGKCGQQIEIHTTRDTSGGHVGSNTVRGLDSARPAPSTLGHQVVQPTAIAHTSSEGGTLPD